MKRILLILSVSVALISCSKDIATDEQVNETIVVNSIQIINNTSAVDLYNIRVDYYNNGINTGSGVFGDVMIGEKSKIIHLDCDYVYVYFMIEKDGVWGNIKVSNPFVLNKNTKIIITDTTQSQLI